MPDRDSFSDLPGLARFGEQLTAAARKAQAGGRRARRPLWRSAAVALAVLVGVSATAAATVALLRASVISAPDPRLLPVEQTPVDRSAVVAAVRSADPAGGPPWALRLTRSQTGLTCTTVGQVKDGVFGIVGVDGVFRRVPPAVSDACGRGLLLGSRIVSATRPRDVRSIVYGVAGPAVRRVVLVTSAQRQTLKVGGHGSFVAALRGYPEDNAARVQITRADGSVVRHALGARRDLVADIDGAPAWRLDRYVLGTRQFCAHMSGARGPASLPTACINRRAQYEWAASALRIRPGQKGVEGFDRWHYQQRPARTVVLGVGRSADAVRRVIVAGLGKPRTLTPSPKGVFAVILPASVDPNQLRFTVWLRDGRVQHGRPGHGIVDDLVASRRPR